MDWKGKRVRILKGEYSGEEGVVMGKTFYDSDCRMVVRVKGHIFGVDEVDLSIVEENKFEKGDAVKVNKGKLKGERGVVWKLYWKSEEKRMYYYVNFLRPNEGRIKEEDLDRAEAVQVMYDNQVKSKQSQRFSRTNIF